MTRRAALLVLAAALVAGCSGDGDPAVQVAEVSRATVAEVVEAPGAVTARATSTLSAPADGVVEAVVVRDGESVRAGQVLVQLSSPAAQERLRQARAAQADAAGAAVSLPRSDLTPVQDALDAAASSSAAAGRSAAALVHDPVLRAQAEAQVTAAEERYRAASAAARAALAAAASGVEGIETAINAVTGSSRAQAAAAVALAQQAVDALTVVSPIDGVVSLGGGGGAGPAPGADVGELLGGLPAGLQGSAQQLLGGGGAGGASTAAVGLPVGAPVSTGTPLLTVTDVSALSVVASVDETDVLLVDRGVRAVVEVDAVPDAVYPGTVSAVDVVPTTSARGGVSYAVRIDLQEGTTGDGPAPPPRPGMSAVVELSVRTAEGVVALGTSALVRDGARDTVFVVEDGVARQRPVRTGAQGEALVEVLSGVRVGERVVVRDADRLRDGQRVEETT